MKKVQTNSSGFALVELLLIILVFAVVVGVGVHFINARKDNKTAATTPVAVTSVKPTTNTTKTEDKKYLPITEWGVKGVDNGLYHLSYEINMPGSFTYALFNSTELAALGGDCAKAGAAGSITRYSNVNAYDTKIGEYYYGFSSLNGPGCGGGTAGAALQQKTNDALKVLFDSLTAI
jgi:hypothetical protein